MTTRMKQGIVAFGVGFALMTGAAAAESFRISTGSQGGSWFPLGGAIKNFIEKASPGTKVSVMPGAGIANVKGVQKGKFPVAFANSVSTVDGIEGRAPFKSKLDKVCNLGTLYPQYLQVIALKSAGIKTIADFKGKALTTQPRGNTGEQMARVLLGAYGMTYKDMSKVHQVSYNDAVALLKDNHAQAFVLGTALPAGSVMNIATARDIMVVPVPKAIYDDLKKVNPAFQFTKVPAGSYPGVDKDVPAVAYATHVIAGCDVSEAIGYKVLTAIADNIDDLASITKSMKGLTIKMMGADIGVPWHKGAIKFYKERGVM
jgi:uncharacterized protein